MWRRLRSERTERIMVRIIVVLLVLLSLLLVWALIDLARLGWGRSYVLAPGPGRTDRFHTLVSCGP
jgi:hypothetical protein